MHAPRAGSNAERVPIPLAAEASTVPENPWQEPVAEIVDEPPQKMNKKSWADRLKERKTKP